MLTLMLVIILPACEKPRTADGPGNEPAIPDAVPVPESAAVPAIPAARQQDESVPPVVETRQPDSLDLRLGDRPEAVQTPPAFGAVPDSGWLDPGSGGTGAAAGQSGLLPDLFGEKGREKPVSVKGNMRFDDDAQEFSDTLDGVEMSVEIKTD